MKTAGYAVVFSGTAVAIGLALLLAVPVPAIRGYGLAGLIVPLASLVCAMTLLPVVLYFIEAPLDRVRLIPKRILARRETEQEGSVWVRLAHAIMRRPLPILLAALVLLVAAAVPAGWFELGPGTNQKLPKELESTQGYEVLSGAVGAGSLAPTDIVVDSGRPGGAVSSDIQAAVGRLIVNLDADREVGGIDYATGPAFVDASRRYVHLQVFGKHDYGLPEAQDFVDRLRDEIIPASGFPAGTRVLAGGGPPSGVDFLDQTYGTFPWLVLAVLVLTYFLLLRAFRSLLLPLKAIVLNLLSIGAAYGLLVVAFKWRAGEAVGFLSFDQIAGWVPVFLFAMLFGLSMDYEVFLVSRMREEWDATKDNRQAVAMGLAKTGRLALDYRPPSPWEQIRFLRIETLSSPSWVSWRSPASRPGSKYTQAAMPIYEYRCKKCEERFEEYLSISTRPAPPCPKCGSTDVVRLVSSFATEWRPSAINWHRAP